MSEKPGDRLGNDMAELEAILDRLESDAKARRAGAAAKAPPPVLPDPDRAELERDLSESRESVSNLLVRLSRERRRARAAMLAVKRRLRAFRRSGKADDVAAAARDLAEARATIASLLREVARRERRAKAERLLRGRAARGRAASPAVPGRPPVAVPDFIGWASAAAMKRIDEDLRALADAGPADPQSSGADECRRLALILRLCAAFGSAPGSDLGAESVSIVDRRLDLWEPAFRRRGASLLREIPRRLPFAAIAVAELEALVDAAVGLALGRLPQGGILLVRAEGRTNAPLQLEFQDNGAGRFEIPAPVAALGSRLEFLETALARELADRRGGSLIAVPVPSGRGLRLTMTLPVAQGPRK